ncbi:exosome non-catalytic core subunit rrp46 [Ascosphaera acerosa]|nr:exosome non-catalytic core subunit rrp46 [Ascosphaera acerosa]
MAPPTTPLATLNPLRFPSGSASYTSPTGISILASANGPMDFHRRDSQQPDEAAVEVFVKPSVGHASVADRHAEAVVRQVVTPIIARRERGMPRAGVVIWDPCAVTADGEAVTL